MRVCLTNLGCKLNQAELEHLARDFADAGYLVTGDLAQADLHVVNTCTVTHVAARDSRKVARRGRRLNPAIRTVLTGCYVASDPQEARRSTGADLIVPNHEKADLLAAVETAFPEVARPQIATDRDPPYAPPEFGNARALVKIEDGCNMPCAFCIIPQTRGRQRSRAPEAILDEVTRLTEAGFPEVVVTGVQISAYRHRGGGLYELTTRLLEETGTRRLRLTSIAPWQFDRRLLGLFDTGRLCRHFHLSLQSGSDRTLERMKRPYSTSAFRALLGHIRDRVPNVAITTDVIAGFPGESESDFEAGLEFVRTAGFARVHVFPYSPRPGTTAATMAGQVDPDVRKNRVRRLLAVASEAERTFVGNSIGQTAEVLWEARKNGAWRGTSDNYIRVVARSDRELSRQLTRSRIIGRNGDVAVASLAGCEPAKITKVEHAA